MNTKFTSALTNASDNLNIVEHGFQHIMLNPAKYRATSSITEINGTLQEVHNIRIALILQKIFHKRSLEF